MNWSLDFLRKSPKVESKELHTESAHVGPRIVWLHGAGQSSTSFNYLRMVLPNWPATLIDYSSENCFYDNLDLIHDSVCSKEPLFVIGHSLGGIYGLHLTQHCNVVGGISIGTPFNGSTIADWAKYIVPSYPLFKDVGPKSRPITQANKIKINIPWTQIVSTTGTVPYLKFPNDGVVTVESMEQRKNDMECIHVKNTHYEVMCSDDVAHIIQQRYEALMLQ
jgi:pimeloyl-ACP methyl ester carboxylesterase